MNSASIQSCLDPGCAPMQGQTRLPRKKRLRALCAKAIASRIQLRTASRVMLERQARKLSPPRRSDVEASAVIIPARYASTRFPGKPSSNLGGRSDRSCGYASAPRTKRARRGARRHGRPPHRGRASARARHSA